MKRTIVFFLLFASTAFGQLPQIVRDNFNSYSAGTDMNGQLVGKVKKLKSSGTDTVGTMVIDNNGRIIASNAAGNNHYGGILFDSTFANNGTDELVFGFTIPVKSTAPAYQNLGNQDFYLFCMMDSSGSPTTGVINGWSGNAVIFGTWNSDGSYSMRFANVANGVISAEYGGSTAGNEGHPNGSSASSGDTIWVKVKGNVINLYRTNANAGSGLMYSQTMTQTVKASGKFALLARQSTSPTTAFNDMFVGLTVPPVVVPPTRDTIPPVVLSAQASAGAVDTSRSFYWTFRAQDNNTSTQKNPGLKSMSIRVDSLGGPFKDSVSSLSNGANIVSQDTTINTVTKKYAQGNYLVTFTAVDDSGNVTRTTVITQVGVARTLWCSAYYDVWQMIPLGATWWAEPPDRLHYNSGITHIIQFPNGGIIPTYPYFAPMAGGSMAESLDVAYGTGRPGTFTYYRDTLIAMAHRNNVRVLLCINAVCANNLITVLDANGNGVIDGADSSRTDTLCTNAALYLSRHNYDGVDINIENGCGSVPSVNHIALLIRRMRAALNTVNAGIGGRMTMTLSPASGAQGNYIASVCNANVDQINPQTYDNQYAWNSCIGSNVGWYSGNVYGPSDAQLGASASCFGAGNRAHSINDHGPGLWFAAGFNKSILGLGVSTYGRLRTPGRAPFEAFTSDGYAATSRGNATAAALLLNGGTLAAYDTVTKSQYISGTALQNATYDGTAATVTAGQGFYFTYPTVRGVQDQVDWIKTNGFSGIMLFDYQMDCDAGNADITQRNPIIGTAAQATGGFTQPLPPAAPTNQTPSNGATSQAIVGLLFSWTAPSGATSYHFQISTSGAFSTITTEFDVSNNQTIVGQNPFTGTLSPNTTYYWHVSASSAAGTSSYSTATPFSTIVQTANPPSTPVQVAPTNGNTETQTTVVLSVSPGSVTDTIAVYKYQVKAADSTAASFVIDDSSGNATTRVLTNLSPGTRYYWRVAAKNGAGTSNFTAYRNFIVQVSAVLTPLTQSAFTFDPSKRSMVLADQVQGTVQQDIPMAQWSPQGLHAGQVKTYPRGFIDSSGLKTPYGSDILNQASTVSQPWTFNAGASFSSLVTATLSLNGFVQTDFAPIVNFTNNGVKNLGLLTNPWLVTYTNGLTLVNTSVAHPNTGLNFLIPDFTSMKSLYVRPGAGRTTDSLVTFGDLTQRYLRIGTNAIPNPLDSIHIVAGTNLSIVKSGSDYTFNVGGVSGMTRKAVQDTLNTGVDTLTTAHKYVDTDGTTGMIQLFYASAASGSEQLRIFANNGTAQIQGRAGGGVNIGDNNSGNFLSVSGTPGFTMAGTSSWRFKFGRNYATERDTNAVWSDSSANNRTIFAIGSRGTISMRDTTACGINAFSGTNTTVSVAVQQAISTDNYVVTLMGNAAPSANDAFRINSTATGFDVTRSASGTSGLQFFWIRVRRK